MFTLQDGREHLYQWDLDRYIIVEDNTICEVHFCNRTSDCSLVVEVKDGLAPIPNILLQEARPIRAYAYCDDKYTLTEQQFTVKSRTRPDDYVYTETEVKSYEALEKRVTHLEEHPVSDEVLANSVETYLANNPVDLSDYYTKGETDTAIYNSKDSYYLDFSKVTYDEQPATAEMIECVTRWLEGKNVCAHVYLGSSFSLKGYIPATISGRAMSLGVSFTPGVIDPGLVQKQSPHNYTIITIKENSNGEIVYYASENYDLVLATTGYVDDAVAAATGVDLANYYTKDETYNREEVEAAIANSGGSCNVPLLPDGYDVDITYLTPGIYGINSNVKTLSEVYCTELNAHVALQWWVSNGMLLIRDRNVVAWGQDNADIMFYTFNMEDYENQSVTLAPSGRLDASGWTMGAVSETRVQEMITDALSGIATAEGGSY